MRRHPDPQLVSFASLQLCRFRGRAPSPAAPLMRSASRGLCAAESDLYGLLGRIRMAGDRIWRAGRRSVGSLGVTVYLYRNTFADEAGLVMGSTTRGATRQTPGSSTMPSPTPAAEREGVWVDDDFHANWCGGDAGAYGLRCCTARRGHGHRVTRPPRRLSPSGSRFSFSASTSGPGVGPAGNVKHRFGIRRGRRANAHRGHAHSAARTA